LQNLTSLLNVYLKAPFLLSAMFYISEAIFFTLKFVCVVTSETNLKSSDVFIHMNNIVIYLSVDNQCELLLTNCSYHSLSKLFSFWPFFHQLFLMISNKTNWEGVCMRLLLFCLWIPPKFLDRLLWSDLENVYSNSISL
jgi:hypothetical protein